MRVEGEIIKLPPSAHSGSMSVEEAIKKRRTIRGFSHRCLTLMQLGQLLWSCYGTTDDRGFLRSVASAGALYPLDIYAASGDQTIRNLPASLFHYLPREHSIRPIVEGDLRVQLAQASLRQMWIAQAPVSIIITVEYERMAKRYGERAIQYAHMEAGHIAQNLFLQAEALQLGAGIVGAFEDDKLLALCHFPVKHIPLLIMPVGYP